MRVIQPDIELWATTWLRAQLTARAESYAAGVFVSNSVPTTRRDRMVIVRHDGGLRASALLELSRIGVQVWAKTRPT